MFTGQEDRTTRVHRVGGPHVFTGQEDDVYSLASWLSEHKTLVLWR